MLSFGCDDPSHLEMFWALYFCDLPFPDVHLTREVRASRELSKGSHPLFPLAGQSSVSTELVYICYSQNIELLHPGSCPAFVYFSEGINSVHRKHRELWISDFAFGSGHFVSSTWVFHHLKITPFWQWWAACWVIPWSSQQHHDILWQGQCPCPEVWVILYSCRYSSFTIFNSSVLSVEVTDKITSVSLHTQPLGAPPLPHHKECGACTTADWSILQHEGGRANQLLSGKQCDRFLVCGSALYQFGQLPAPTNAAPQLQVTGEDSLSWWNQDFRLNMDLEASSSFKYPSSLNSSPT